MNTSWPAPTRAAHKRFVETEGWTQLTSVRGNTGNHYRYELAVGDDIIRTRISHPPSSKETYGRKRWSHILRDQLKVSEAEFWECVTNGILPQRSRPPAAASAPQKPIAVVNLLINKVGLSGDEVRALTTEEATERLNQYWTEGQ